MRRPSHRRRSWRRRVDVGGVGAAGHGGATADAAQRGPALLQRVGGHRRRRLHRGRGGTGGRPGRRRHGVGDRRGRRWVGRRHARDPRLAVVRGPGGPGGHPPHELRPRRHHPLRPRRFLRRRRPLHRRRPPLRPGGGPRQGAAADAGVRRRCRGCLPPRPDERGTAAGGLLGRLQRLRPHRVRAAGPRRELRLQAHAEAGRRCRLPHQRGLVHRRRDAGAGAAGGLQDHPVRRRLLPRTRGISTLSSASTVATILREMATVGRRMRPQGEAAVVRPQGGAGAPRPRGGATLRGGAGRERCARRAPRRRRRTSASADHWS